MKSRSRGSFGFDWRLNLGSGPLGLVLGSEQANPDRPSPAIIATAANTEYTLTTPATAPPPPLYPNSHSQGPDSG